MFTNAILRKQNVHRKLNFFLSARNKSFYAIPQSGTKGLQPHGPRCERTLDSVSYGRPYVRCGRLTLVTGGGFEGFGFIKSNLGYFLLNFDRPGKRKQSQGVMRLINKLVIMAFFVLIDRRTMKIVYRTVNITILE
ncbi:hypothetical protein DPMN_098462 [Dreissena polymorpha]|uniref:Uncharacterized protein n=1 Tax=Dreissena polymorpha TaxID=45954 RepID=A0A9D4LDR0_DREPO|nr:hypothetical protein DPMN_098462 [Dreissena polymorpha]